MATNDITGDKLVSRPSSDLYRDNWDRIYGGLINDKGKSTEELINEEVDEDTDC